MRTQVILSICLIAAVSFPVWSMADDVTIPITQFEPQQSKTGPEPPPGVLPKAPDLRPLDRADNLMTGVPGYAWRHGCGPTAVGMVVGYYDGYGFPELIPGDASTQTTAVNQAMASQNTVSDPLHYEDYSLPMDSGQPAPLPDRSEDPPGDEHPDDSIADYMHTSWSSNGNYYGWSYSSRIGLSFTGYINQMAPQYQATYQNYYSLSSLTWEVLMGEIDNNRPMVFLVDTDGNGGTDHFVTIVGYRDSGGYQEYGCLDTWSPASVVRWERFRSMAAGSPWGIWGGTRFSIVDPMEPTPTPTVTPGPVCINHGDVSGDGLITAEDAQMAFGIALEMITPTPEEACAADCNGDDIVTAGDAQAIFAVVMGTGSCADPLL